MFISFLIHVCIQTNQWQEHLRTTFSATLINNIVPLRIQNYMIDNEMIEEKIGEVLGLEMAAQKAV